MRATTWVDGDGEDYFEAVKAQGLEGVIAKRRASRYQPGARSRDWLEGEGPARAGVRGVRLGAGPHRGAGGGPCCVHDDEGVLVHVGGVGTGFTAAQRRALAEQLAPLATDEPPCQRAPCSKTARWVRPELVVRCEFAEWTGDEHVRQASFKGLAPTGIRRPCVGSGRWPPGPCLANPGGGAGRRRRGIGADGRRAGRRLRGGAVAERLLDGPPGLPPLGRTQRRRAGRPRRPRFGRLAAGRSHPRTDQPRQGAVSRRPDGPELLTKGDLVRYYATVAPVMLAAWSSAR